MDAYVFSRRQAELMSEFARYLVDHPEIDASLPERSYIYFEVAGEDAFNRYSRELAENHHRHEGVPPVLVRIKGLAPPHGSRLIEPVIENTTAIA
jgi:hypothetical protein